MGLHVATHLTEGYSAAHSNFSLLLLLKQRHWNTIKFIANEQHKGLMGKSFDELSTIGSHFPLQDFT